MVLHPTQEALLWQYHNKLCDLDDLRRRRDALRKKRRRGMLRRAGREKLYDIEIALTAIHIYWKEKVVQWNRNARQW